MTRCYFAGLNTRQIAGVLEGEDVLFSFAYVKTHNAAWRKHILPRLQAGAYRAAILDSGAFTELRNPGFHVSLEEYIGFVQEYGHLFDMVITLDDIRGDLERTWLNTEALEANGCDVMPVFHGREPWSVLEAYCRRYDRICLGFARDRGRIARDQGGVSPDAWLGRALDICEAHGVTVHGLGMTHYARGRGHTRLATTDSTTWIAEYCAILRCETDSPLSRTVAAMPRDDVARLAVRSYSAGAPVQDAADATWIDASAKGQARSVFRRYGAPALLETLRELAGYHLIIERKAA
jgi:hypothetical protein